MLWIIILLLISTKGLVLFSSFVFKPNIIKAQEFFTVENITYIMPSASGKTCELLVEDGSSVETGQTKVKLDTSEIDLKILQYDNTISIYETRDSLYQRLIDYISNDYSKDDDNHFLIKTIYKSWNFITI